MKNIEMTLDSNILTIRVDLEQSPVILSGEEGIVIPAKEPGRSTPCIDQCVNLLADNPSRADLYLAEARAQRLGEYLSIREDADDRKVSLSQR